MSLILALLVGLAGPVDLVPKTVKPIWRKSFGSTAGSQYLAADGEHLLTVNWSGQVISIDPATGKRRWRLKPAKKNLINDTQVGLANGVAVVRWPDVRELKGHNAKTGKVVWARTLSSPATSLIACTHHAVLVATYRQDGALIAEGIVPKTGQALWQAKVKGRVISAGGSVVITEERSNFGVHAQGLQAIDCATGKATAIQRGRGAYVRLLDVAQDKVAAVYYERGYSQQQICVGPINGTPNCFSPTDGLIPEYAMGSALIKGSRLYIGAGHSPGPNSNSVFIYDIDTQKIMGRSERLTANGPIHDAGGLIASGFGATGSDDFIYLLDPDDTRRVRTLKLRKSPQVITSDTERVYVGSYDGKIAAIKLPLPGRKPVILKAVQPTTLDLIKPPVDVGWKQLTILNVHPKTGRTSGNHTDGAVGAIDFLGASGDRIATGGNDNRVRVTNVKTGKLIWKSKKLSKNVNGIQACASGTFAAQIYGGQMTLFEANGRRYKKRKPINHKYGWFFGFDSTCTHVIADSFEGKFTVYDAKTSKRRASFEAKGEFDRGGLRVVGKQLLVSRPNTLSVINIVDMQEGPSEVAQVKTPKTAHGGTLVQAFLVNKTMILREYCSLSECVIELVPITNGVTKTLRFNTTGGVWGTSVPSMIAVSPTGHSLVWYRDGLEMLIVEVTGDKRRSLGVLPRTMSSTPRAVFSKDGDRLAITMDPKSYQVTIFERVH